MADRMKSKLLAWSNEAGVYLTAQRSSIGAFDVFTAVGIQLDELGRLYATIRRLGEGDGAYKMRLINAYKRASDCGNINGVISAVENHTGLTSAILRDIRPAGIEARFYRQGDQIPAGAEKRAKKSVATGVTLNILLINDDETAFKFDTPGHGYDSGVGFIAGFTA